MEWAGDTGGRKNTTFAKVVFLQNIMVSELSRDHSMYVFTDSYLCNRCTSSWCVAGVLFVNYFYLTLLVCLFAYL